MPVHVLVLDPTRTAVSRVGDSVPPSVSAPWVLRYSPLGVRIHTTIAGVRNSRAISSTTPSMAAVSKSRTASDPGESTGFEVDVVESDAASDPDGDASDPQPDARATTRTPTAVRCSA